MKPRTFKLAKKLAKAIRSMGRPSSGAGRNAGLATDARQAEPYGNTPPPRLFVPPGHFYSPIPSLEEVKRDAARIFGPPPAELPAIDLNVARQLALIDSFREFYPEMPFQDRKSETARYCFLNPAYSYTDAIFLYSMIRRFSPARVLEIGSGHSSCVILDTNERFLDARASLTFVDPHPQLLRSLLKPGDLERVRILERRVQDVSLTFFDELEENDILFIDSTHVGKTGSDVNFLLFEALPRLKPGVLVHFHDIFYPFEYPPAWVQECRAWNECYLLRSFLEFNTAFEVLLFSHYLVLFHRQAMVAALPKCAGNWGGNLWLRRR